MHYAILDWFSRILSWSSQTVNVWLLFGHHDQSVSARAHVNRGNPKWNRARVIINRIFFWHQNHCLQSHIRDIEYARQILGLDK